MTRLRFRAVVAAAAAVYAAAVVVAWAAQGIGDHDGWDS